MERSIHDALCVVKVFINLFSIYGIQQADWCVLLKPHLGNLSESLSQSLWSSAVVVLKLPSPSTLRTLRPLFHPGGFYHVILDLKYKNRFTLQRTTCHCWLCQVPAGHSKDPGGKRSEGLRGPGRQAESLPQLQPDQEGAWAAEELWLGSLWRGGSGQQESWCVRARHLQDQVLEVCHRGRHHNPEDRRHDQVAAREGWGEILPAGLRWWIPERLKKTN